MDYPIPSSSDDSRGVPHRRHMTAAQSPQLRGSLTSSAQVGQYSTCDSGLPGGGCGSDGMNTGL